MRLDVAATVMPAGADRAAGDFWVRYDRPDGAAFLVVGDVGGHGELVAPDAAAARRAFHAAAGRAATPCELLEDVNADVRARAGGEPPFVTAVAVLFEPAGRRVSWAYAGHLPPHRLDVGLPLDGAEPGLPLGVAERVNCTTASQAGVELGTGLLLYTDGLEDARGPGGDRFGVARVTRVLARAAGQSVDATVDGLRRDVCAFAGGELRDDICIVAVRAA